MTLAPVLRSVWVPQDPADAFDLFTNDIGAWWPLPTHGMFGERSGGLGFVNDELREIATDGTETVWGSVLEWTPPSKLVITWHPGREADDHSEVEVRFESANPGTNVVLEHRGWEHFGSEAMRRRRPYVGPGAWGSVLEHFADVCEPRLDGADLTPLIDAYEAFFAEAELGGFGQPTDNGWNAEQTIAHVALNDLAIVAVSHGLIHGRQVRFDNIECHAPEALSRWIADATSRGGVVEAGRQTAARVVRVLARLNEEQRETEVHCRLQHHGETMVDEPRPWGTIAIEAQSGMHLPAHIEQLRNLRP